MICISVESVTIRGEVAIIEDNNTLALIQLPIGHNHGKEIASAISQMMSQLKMKLSAVDAICVDLGPGSYTGIRVALAYAKGISVVTGIPIYGANSLKAIAHDFFAKFPDEKSVTVLMDAKWDELYMGEYQKTEINSTDHGNTDVIPKTSDFTKLAGKGSSIAYTPEQISGLFSNAGVTAACIYPTSNTIARLAVKDKLDPVPIYVRKIPPQLKKVDGNQ